MDFRQSVVQRFAEAQGLAGVAGLDFKGSGADYFTGKAEGALNNGVLAVTFRSKTARACSYAFELRPVATSN